MGKVHGSLARAGKVKSQTPKVERQEKAKVPKGRAKKRLQKATSPDLASWAAFRQSTFNKESNRFPVHSPLCQCDFDRWWQEKDEPQPWLINAMLYSIAREQPKP
ncbi:ribosomal protein S30-domain-containing protein [Xylaria digitata]|nr:ribosomal protein S30-domain-containing protein [Xylaria digitata]